MNIFRHNLISFSRFVQFFIILCQSSGFLCAPGPGLKPRTPLVMFPMFPMGFSCQENNMAAAQDAIADVEVEAVELAEAARENKVTSILDRLRAPNASDLSRKRRLVVNTGGNRRAQGKVSAKKAVYEPKISAEERVEKFKDETLKVVRGNTLFCQSCKEEISVKKSNLSTHISSKKQNQQRETGENGQTRE